ncbi:MAG: BrnT family toxin [Magnetococcales bacterium]|nr:BrnT family toxin [Magnetococcales bacterium]
MKYIYENTQRRINIERHQLDFSIIYGFDFNHALWLSDHRKNYCVDRFIASGHIESRLYIVVFTVRDDAIRLISLRKANKREVTLLTPDAEPICDGEDDILTQAAVADSDNPPLTSKEILRMRPRKTVTDNENAHFFQT